MNRVTGSVVLLAAMAIGTLPGAAQDETATVFTNVNLWDGRSEALSQNMNVLV